MVHQPPVTAAGSREADKRPRPVPAKVKAAIRLMVLGRLDDPDCKPLDFIAAAKECGVKPDVMRRYLDRPQVRALLMAERRAFRLAICASNEASLLDIRNNAANAMARIGAIRQLEQMEEISTGAGRHGGSGSGYLIDLAERPPGMTIIIRSTPAGGTILDDQPPIDVTPDRTTPTPASPVAFGLPASQLLPKRG